MKKTNSQSGITLIALVVTIVVLLILAGITINIVLSDGGIFAKAQQAGVETRIATVKDYAQGAVTSLYAECATTGADVKKEVATKILEGNFPKDAEWKPEPTVEAKYTPIGEDEEGNPTPSKIVVKIDGTVTTSTGKYTVSYDSGTSSTIKVTEEVEASEEP